MKLREDLHLVIAGKYPQRGAQKGSPNAISRQTPDGAFVGGGTPGEEDGAN